MNGCYSWVKQAHEVRFANCRPIQFGSLDENHVMGCLSRKSLWLSQLSLKLSSELSERNVPNLGEYLQVELFTLSICSKENCPYKTTNRIEMNSAIVFCCCSCLVADENLAWKSFPSWRSMISVQHEGAYYVWFLYINIHGSSNCTWEYA